MRDMMNCPRRRHIIFSNVANVEYGDAHITTNHRNSSRGFGTEKKLSSVIDWRLIRRVVGVWC